MRRILGNLLLFVTVFSTPVWAQRYAVFPEFVVGGGWSSEFFFTNQDLSPVTGIVVSFFDENGAALSITSNLGVNSTYTFNLNAGATQQITVTPSSSEVVGYAVMTYPSYSTPIRASVIYRYEQGGTVSAEVGAPHQEQGDNYSFPVESDKPNGIRTAVALVNPAAYNGSTPVAETVMVNLINLDGSLNQQLTVPLQSGQHVGKYIDELFPNLGAFTGSVSVSSPLGVGVLALRQDQNAFGGTSTDGGPILGPFALSSTPIPEVEPNDTPQTAQLISGSVVISGTISQAGDQDAYQFTGKAGDIISVICTTEGLGSSLDSTVGIYDSSASNPIGWNDQNGLAPGGYPENDSFLQMVLPADGTYYVVVSDYNGNGGSNYTYMLHIKLP